MRLMETGAAVPRKAVGTGSLHVWPPSVEMLLY